MSETLTTTLDRLVRKSVITDFEMPPGSNAVLLHVVVAAPVVTNPHGASYCIARLLNGCAAA